MYLKVIFSINPQPLSILNDEYQQFNFDITREDSAISLKESYLQLEIVGENTAGTPLYKDGTHIN